MIFVLYAQLLFSDLKIWYILITLYNPSLSICVKFHNLLFMVFIGVILNMRTMLLASIVEYWSIRFNSRILFYSEVFTRDRFRQIFWWKKKIAFVTYNPDGEILLYYDCLTAESLEKPELPVSSRIPLTLEKKNSEARASYR
ncbi:hypothetical protein WN51_13729 [Melipona quadrifasciata]|uniref:PiggyBac transposable element-derived protein domain-containing protein n=1 Tax=Melipona quadrifasciata TaxID=166423 RepID=A0A0N0U4W6_9HYME|nr:hypothetical protein WN51_13729 [Melipona quadrifasciata]